ncbi:MAG TPA: hypothetical protein VIM42_10125 [Clostridium sp.]
MQTTQTLISSSGDIYSSYLSYLVDGLNNTNGYLIDLSIETQNPNGGLGMILDKQVTFNVSYPSLKVLNKPLITEILDKSAVQINWANICTNPGTLSGVSSYINNFINYSNTALSLNIGTTLNYSTSVIPSKSTCSFMIKIPKTFDGIIRTTNDGKYQIGYNLSQNKFYTIINSITNYSELIVITENPFYITCLPSKAIIRQYNIYNQVKNVADLNVSDIYNMPVAFMIQINN